MKPKQSRSNGDTMDRLGVVASFACAVHCLAMPLTIGLLPLAGLEFLADERLEWGFILTAICIGAGSLIPSYLHCHRRMKPMLWFGMGVVIIVAGHLFWEENPGFETPAIFSGAAAIVFAHLLNRKFRHLHSATDHSHC